jgi:hypothetical protein
MKLAKEPKTPKAPVGLCEEVYVQKEIRNDVVYIINIVDKGW